MEGSASDPDHENLFQFLMHSRTKIQRLPHYNRIQGSSRLGHLFEHNIQPIMQPSQQQRTLYRSCKDESKKARKKPSRLMLLTKRALTAMALLPANEQLLATHNTAAPCTPLHPICGFKGPDSCLYFGQFGQGFFGEVSQEQLSYVRALDKVNEEDSNQKVSQMLDHKIKKHHNSCTLIAKVGWLIGLSFWVDFQALVSYDPCAMVCMPGPAN